MKKTICFIFGLMICLSSYAYEVVYNEITLTQEEDIRICEECKSIDEVIEYTKNIQFVFDDEDEKNAWVTKYVNKCDKLKANERTSDKRTITKDFYKTLELFQLLTEKAQNGVIKN